MRKVLLGILAATALSVGTAAGATDVVMTPNTVLIGTPDGLAAGESATFLVAGDIFNGDITATFSHNGIPGASAGTSFTDLFTFTIPQNGLGSGDVTTSVNLSGFGGSADTDLLSVLVNGTPADLILKDANNVVCTTRGVGTCGAVEQWSVTDIAITANVLNTITINGISRGLGGYSGHATFTPVPEPATWGMMLLGFGAVGFSMRRRRRPAALMQIA